MKAHDRFLKYVTYDTQSDAESTSAPSTPKQLILADELKKELEEIGLQNVIRTPQGIVYATLPATDESMPSIGFISHMDTASELSGKNVKPRVIENWDGSTIVLNDEYSMNPEDFPQLKTVIGDSIIVTDGTTLLGNDDKAGIAIIMQTLDELKNSNQPHGKIMAAFTPDEEVGRGVENFDLSEFPVDFAYTVDGAEVNGVDYETFNAAQAEVIIHGKSIHPGSAKDQMINAAEIACRFAAAMPEYMTAEHTEGREGFIHLISVSGECEKSRLIFIIRDHNRTLFEKKKEWMRKVCSAYEVLYPGRIELNIHDQYENMRNYADEDLSTVKKAYRAVEKEGLIPVSLPVRGGTDGAVLSARGLFCPNLGTGGGNCHGRFEFASCDKMDQMVRILKNIALEDVK